MGHRRFFHRGRFEGLEVSAIGAEEEEEEEEEDEFDEVEADEDDAKALCFGWSFFVFLAKGESGIQLSRGNDICARLDDDCDALFGHQLALSCGGGGGGGDVLAAV